MIIEEWRVRFAWAVILTSWLSIGWKEDDTLALVSQTWTPKYIALRLYIKIRIRIKSYTQQFNPSDIVVVDRNHYLTPGIILTSFALC